MENMNQPGGLARRQTGMPGSVEPSEEMTQLKSELVLMKKKYERLAKKEARLQVSFSWVELNAGISFMHDPTLFYMG